MPRYCIIGAGIAGASVAYHLSEKTTDPITVYDRGQPGDETTRKSVAQYGFYGDQTQYRMKRYGLRLYNEFFRDPRADPRYHTMGLLLMATEPANAAALEAAAAGEAADAEKIALGADRDLVEYLDPDALAETLLLPPVNTDALAGGLFRPKVGYMSRPRALAVEFLERARENGVRVEPDTPVTEITTKADRVTGVIADGQEAAADAVVCAAGPWNPLVAESVGVDLPVKHTLAPILHLEPPAPVEYDVPVLSHYESPYAFHRRTPRELLVGYNPGPEAATRYDPGEVSETVPADIRDEGLGLLADLVPGWTDAEPVNEWVGVRSQTPDENPIVGWTELEGFLVAAFHTSGIQLAPAVGSVIARQLVDHDPTEFYDALSVTRFDGYHDTKPEDA